MTAVERLADGLATSNLARRAVLRAASDPSVAVRERALIALEGWASPDSTQALVHALVDAEASVRAVARRDR